MKSVVSLSSAAPPSGGDGLRLNPCTVERKPEVSKERAQARTEVSDWKLEDWLKSLGCLLPSVQALKEIAQGEHSDLALVRAIASCGSRDPVPKSLQTHDVLEKLADDIWDGMQKLAVVPAKGAELHHKFLQDTRNFELSFGGLSTFFGGMEALIGSPRVGGHAQ